MQALGRKLIFLKTLQTLQARSYALSSNIYNVMTNFHIKDWKKLLHMIYMCKHRVF